MPWWVYAIVIFVVFCIFVLMFSPFLLDWVLKMQTKALNKQKEYEKRIRQKKLELEQN